jgi:hypothetical protein
LHNMFVTHPPMTASASGSLKPVQGLFSLHRSGSWQQVAITGQVEEVWFLVEFVEDSTRSVLDIGGSEDGDGVLWEGFGEVRATFVEKCKRVAEKK